MSQPLHPTQDNTPSGQYVATHPGPGEIGNAPSTASLEAALAAALAGMTTHPVGLAAMEIGGPSVLPPEEEATIAAAVPKRRNEFGAGRCCARRALAAIGGPCCPIPVGRVQQPVWPAFYDGTISHDGRFAAALAYRLTPRGPRLSLDIIDRVDCAPYLDVLRLVVGADEGWDALDDAYEAARMFSAKEAAIKIISPWLDDYVDFRSLAAIPVEGGFHVALSGAEEKVAVRSLAVHGVIMSVGMALPGGWGARPLGVRA